MEEKTSLILKFDPNTIAHLGISLYSRLPSVLSELISNSWDADANIVKIYFTDNGNEKTINYIDDGEGMTFEELNDKYLVIGRNRRKENKQEESIGGRKVIGKKGLGKLSVFGICDIIEVKSIKNELANQFELDFNQIKTNKDSFYKPKILKFNEKTNEKNGTTITLKRIRRKSGFELNSIGESLSKQFLIFDQMNVQLILNNTSSIVVSNELKYAGMKKQFEWELPDKKYDENYEFWDKLNGKIFTLETPVKDTELRGIYLTSRNKVVNEASFFGLRDNDQFHSYVTGYISVDFIDEFSEDVISTDRHSLIWENDKTKDLQNYLQKIIKKIGSEWRDKRSILKRETIKNEKHIDVAKWQSALPTYEKELSNKILDPILSNSNIDINDSASLISNVIDKFNNKTFKDYASKIADSTDPSEIPNLIKLMDDWKIIEAKQFHDLAYSRIEVIKQFENHINTNTKEVPTLHNFLKKFSWLLDPRILEFKDEVTYSDLLKTTFPDNKLDEKNRRIDFLCSNALGEILYVIEIKRSKYIIDVDALEQAYSYGAFLKKRYSSETGFSKVVCFVVGGEKSDDYRFTAKEDTYSKSGEVFVKTYRELLEQSKEYHKEFIKTYDSFNQKKIE